MKLYELTAAYRNVWDMMEDDEIDIETINDTLQSIEGAIEVKAENLAVFVKRLEGMADTFKAEEKRLQERRKAFENRVKHIKDYLQNNMEMAGISKINAGTFIITLQKNSRGSVIIEDEKKVPAKYLTIIPEQYVPNKDAMENDLKNKIDIPGASLLIGKHLRIR